MTISNLRDYVLGLLTLLVLVASFWACDKSDLSKPLAAITDPKAKFEIDTNTIREFSFVNLSTNANTFFWDFGDSSISTEINPIHFYTKSGLFNVTLIAERDGERDTAKTILNLVDLNTDFQIIEIKNGKYEFQSLYEASSYRWDFGDSSISNLVNPIHEYSKGGSYNVSLYATYEGVKIDTFSEGNISKFIDVLSPSAYFTYSISNLTDNFDDFRQLNLTNSSSNADELFVWDFGDGDIVVEPEPTKIYSEDGEYEVKLAAYNGVIEDIFTRQIKIRNWQLINDNPPFSEFLSGNLIEFNDKLWVIGGYLGYADDQQILTKEIWNTVDGVNWYKVNVNAEFEYVYASTCVVFKDKIWLYPGDFGDFNPRPAFFSMDGQTWEKVNLSIPMYTYKSDIVEFNEKLWYIGRDATSGPLNVYSSIDGIIWNLEMDSLIARIWDYELVAFNNKLWLIGGRTDDGQELGIIRSSSDGKNWVIATQNPEFVTISSVVSVVFNNKIWLIEYKHDDGLDYGVWSSLNGVNWEQEQRLPALIGDVYSPSATVFMNSIWMTGGSTFDYGDDVWKY